MVGQRPSVGEGSVPVRMVQRAEAVGAQGRRDLGVFILGENDSELKSTEDHGASGSAQMRMTPVRKTWKGVWLPTSFRAVMSSASCLMKYR